MKKVESIVVVGGGLAAANAAFELRERGYTGSIRLISDEASLPYERPPLSKGYLRGEEPIDKALVRPAGEYASQNVEVVRGHVTRLHLSERKVELADGRLLGYQRLLIATGAEPRRLDIPGSELPGIHYLRNIEDADGIRDAAAQTGEAVVIGGGWIGTEVAASLRQLGHEVTLIAPPPRPLEQLLGPDVAEAYRRLHEEQGVRLVDGFAASLEGSGAVEQVMLQDGKRIPARMVVAGIGAIARIELAQESGLRLRDTGIEVDERLETSIAGVFAAGDVATAWHPRFGRHVRVEHWDNAIEQGKMAARNMLGAAESYARTPYFYSDQFDLGMEYRGYSRGWDTAVIRGDLGAREFDAFWLADGRVVAAMNANRWDDAAGLQALVESQARVKPAALADDSIPLASLSEELAVSVAA